MQLQQNLEFSLSTKRIAGQVLIFDQTTHHHWSSTRLELYEAEKERSISPKCLAIPHNLPNKERFKKKKYLLTTSAAVYGLKWATLGRG